MLDDDDSERLVDVDSDDDDDDSDVVEALNEFDNERSKIDNVALSMDITIEPVKKFMTRAICTHPQHRLACSGTALFALRPSSMQYSLFRAIVLKSTDKQHIYVFQYFVSK